MKRCAHFPFAALVFLAAATSLLAVPARAQQAEDVKPNVRPFPKAALRGELVVFMTPEITVNGKPDRLSPAARIRDVNNNLVLPGTLAAQKLVVNYVRDNTGLVQHVWILNGEEARQKMPSEDSGGILTNIRSRFDTPAVSDDGNTPYDQLPRYRQ